MHDDMKLGEPKNTKSAAIMGGTSGIGLSIALSFLSAGYVVFVGGRTERALKNSDLRFVKVDACSEAGHSDLIDHAISCTGALDVYINNVGQSAWRPLSKIDEGFLDRMLDVNLKSAFWGCKQAARRMQHGGTIINVSSLAGKRGSLNNSAYVAAKFGINGLTQSLAKELGVAGIRVNAVCPVLIKTEGLIAALEEKDSPSEGDVAKFLESFERSNTALGRLPEAREVADTCVYLASAYASAITGQCLNVDCGVLPQ